MINTLLTLSWIILLSAALRYIPFFQNIKGLSFTTITIIFLVRVFTGLIFLLLYTYYFDPATADVHRFFSDSKVLFSALSENPLDYFRMLTGIGASAEHLSEYYQAMPDWHRPWVSHIYNDNRILIRFNALMQLFSFGILPVHVVIANFVTLSGFVAIYKFAVRYLSHLKSLWLIPGIFLMPSVLFWSSGVIKETLLFPVMGFFVLYADKLLDREGPMAKNLIIVASMLGLFLLLKAYILFLLIPCYAAFRIAKANTKPASWLVFPLVTVIYIVFLLISGQFLTQYNLISLIAGMQNMTMLFSLSVGAGSLIHEVFLEPSFISIISYLPRAFINTLVYPHLFQKSSPVLIVAGIENIMIIIMLVMIIIYGIKKRNITALAWMGIWLTLITFTFIGTISQVSGSLVRYKIPALPFLWMAFISIVPVENLQNWYNKRASSRKFE